MKINGKKVNFYQEIFKPALKQTFGIKSNKLERQPEQDTVEINKFPNTPGIKSHTFHKLLSPEFTPKRRIAPNGTRVTTLIDKKTNKPVEAFVAAFETEQKDCERFVIMVKDPKGDINIQNEKHRIVGDTYFYINKEKKMITPKFEPIFIDGELSQKVLSFMRAKGNKEFAGIGTRLHQIKIERMMQNNLGNVNIVADGNSFPFHYDSGFRIKATCRPIEDLPKVLQELSIITKKPPKENAGYIDTGKLNGELVINMGATIENFLNDHYRNGGKTIEYFSPDMLLDQFSFEQWQEMIKKQPILYDKI